MVDKKVQLSGLEQQMKTMHGDLAADIVNSDRWKEEAKWASEHEFPSGKQYTHVKKMLEKEFKVRNKMLYVVPEPGKRRYMTGVDAHGHLQFGTLNSNEGGTLVEFSSVR